MQLCDYIEISIYCNKYQTDICGKSCIIVLKNKLIYSAYFDGIHANGYQIKNY